MNLLYVALAPVLAVALFFYERDHEKEPRKLLIWAFFLGMAGVVPTLILGAIMSVMGFDPESDSLAWSFISITLMIALVEELSKFFGVRMWIYRKADFNEPYDGIVYCVMAALGFAALENVMYVMQGGLGVGIGRAFTSIPAHAVMGVFIGYFLGIQKHDGKRGYEFIGLAAAVTFHAFYDFFLINAEEYPVFLLLCLGMFIWAMRLGWVATQKHLDRSPFRPGADSSANADTNSRQ